MIDFSNNVALVTGGGSGIGRACALSFAQYGAQVMVADLVSDGGLRTVEMIRDAGGEASFVQVDVSRSDEVAQMGATALQRYGRIDVAVNAAGIPGKQSDTIGWEESEIDRVHAVNVRGLWLCMREEIRDMLTRRRGAIVNISSGGGLTAAPSLAGYCASKHAVVGLTKTAAVEYAASGIRVNAVCPGAVRTPMMEIAMQDPGLAVRILQSPMARLAEPQEIADASLFLCSQRASFITGVPFPVDGGMLAH